MLVLRAAPGLVACGGEEAEDASADAVVEQPAADAQPAGDAQPPGDANGGAAQEPESEEIDLSEFLSTEESVDLMIDTHVDMEELCSSWGTAQQLGAEDVAYEGFEEQFAGDEGFSAREASTSSRRAADRPRAAPSRLTLSRRPRPGDARPPRGSRTRGRPPRVASHPR